MKRGEKTVVTLATSESNVRSIPPLADELAVRKWAYSSSSRGGGGGGSPGCLRPREPACSSDDSTMSATLPALSSRTIPSLLAGPCAIGRGHGCSGARACARASQAGTRRRGRAPASAQWPIHVAGRALIQNRVAAGGLRTGLR